MRLLCLLVGLILLCPTYSAEYNHSTDKTPVVVKVQSPVIIKHQDPVTVNGELRVKGDITAHTVPLTADEKKRAKDKDDDDHALSDATVSLNKWTMVLALVAILQMVLFMIQLWFTRASLDDARKAADVAKASADAAKASSDTAQKTERAWLIIRVEIFAFNLPNEGRGMRAKVIVTNQGKTPAVLRIFRGYLQFRRDVPVALHEHDNARNQMPEGLAIGADSDESFEVFAHLTEDEMNMVRAIDGSVFAMGLVNYDDVMGNNHETGYCWMTQVRFDRIDFYIAPSRLNYIN